MKRFLAILLVLTMIIVTVSGCKTPPSSSSPSSATIESSQEPSSEPVEVSSSDPSEVSSDEPVVSEEVSSEGVKLSKEQQRAENIDVGLDDQLINAAITVHEGLTIDKNGKKHVKNQNAIRVAKAISKAQSGGTVTIAFIGGENTANSNSIESTYIAQVKDWWTTTFPGKVNIIEAGYYTMSSSIAIYRLRHDVLQYKPDLVFVDFAVQDAFGGASKTNGVTFENLVRRVLESSSSTGVIVLLLGGAETTSFVMTPGNCDPIVTASKYELQVADYYNLPVIDFNNAAWDTIFTLVDSRPYGEFPLLKWETFADLNTGLNGVGHINLAKMITNYLGIVAGDIKTISKTVPALPATFRFGNNTFMKADMVTPYQLLTKPYTAGYSISESADDLSTATYSLRLEGPSIANQSIVCYRPTSFININLPEVTNDTPTYFFVTTSPKISPDPAYDYSPITLVYYDKTGAVVGTNKPTGGDVKEAIQSYRVDKVRIPNGTCRIEYKVYIAGGLVAFNGLGIEKPTTTIKG